MSTGNLMPRGRFAVEDHLRQHPDLAARVMGDLGTRSALQLLARDSEPLLAPIAPSHAGRFAHSWSRTLAALGSGWSDCRLRRSPAALLASRSKGRPIIVDARGDIAFSGGRSGADTASQLRSLKFDPARNSPRDQEFRSRKFRPTGRSPMCSCFRPTAGQRWSWRSRPRRRRSSVALCEAWARRRCPNG